MNVNELRIGNLVYHKDNPLPQKVDGIDLYKIQSEYISEYSMPDHFKPIPIVEELLLKFGFTKNEHDLTLDNGYVLFRFFPLVRGFEIVIEGQALPLYKYYYIHQIQNIYFALTGEEL